MERKKLIGLGLRTLRSLAIVPDGGGESRINRGLIFSRAPDGGFEEAADQHSGYRAENVGDRAHLKAHEQVGEPGMAERCFCQGVVGDQRLFGIVLPAFPFRLYLERQPTGRQHESVSADPEHRKEQQPFQRAQTFPGRRAGFDDQLAKPLTVGIVRKKIQDPFEGAVAV